MSVARPLAAALVAGAVSGAAHRALTGGRAPEPGSPWTRTNHAGVPVTLLEGPAYVAGAAAGAAVGSGSGAAPGLLAAVGSGCFGALDDLAGDGSSKGLRGHFGAAARGEVTTGFVKVLGLGATGLAAAALADRRTRASGGPPRGPLDVLVGGAVIAGAANLANLLDLRPGRALKASLAASVPLVGPGPGRVAAAAAAGAALGVLRPDLAGRAMLGDTGANAAGALLGTALVERVGSARTARRAGGAHRAHPRLGTGQLHPRHRVHAGAPRARRLGPAGPMSARRVATGIAGAAGLIAAVTMLARAAGFARVLVFADSVRSGGVGTIYQSVNTLPNVVFEVAAGGVLAAAAVPLIAHRIGTGERDRADHAASVLLTWVLVVLVPVAALLALTARPLSTFLVTGEDAAAAEVAVRLLRVFALQVPLYGVGIILTGLLHAHRRFLAAALAPFLSSLVVLASYLWYGAITGGRTDPSAVPAEAVTVLGWGTTLGVLVLSLPLLGPALATGWRWRPSLRLPREDARRVAGLAGAGVVALLAQQGAALVTMRLANYAGGDATYTVYAYVQAVYLLPYAVLAVPVAQSAFPALATRVGAGQDSSGTVARATRGVLALTGVAAGVLIAAAPAVGAFFGLLDARRGTAGSSPDALAAMPTALTAYAPGLAGFGLVALLTRALYVRGRPMDAAVASALGWVVAAVPPLLLVAPGDGPARTLWTLGVWSSLGMTVAAGSLLLLVRRAWGPGATAGTARTAGAVVVALAVEWVVGDLVTHGRSMDSLPGALVVGLVAGVAALAAGFAVLAVGDRGMMQEVRARGRARRRRGGAG